MKILSSILTQSIENPTFLNCFPVNTLLADLHKSILKNTDNDKLIIPFTTLTELACVEAFCVIIHKCELQSVTIKLVL